MDVTAVEAKTNNYVHFRQYWWTNLLLSPSSSIYSYRTM